MSEKPFTVLSPYRWVILALMWCAAFIGVAAQFQVAALAYKIIPAIKLSPSQFSMVLSAPMLAGVVFSLTAGALADRFGVKRVVTAGFAFSVVGVYFRYAAQDFWQLFILMFLAGISTGLLNTNVAKLLGAWFPREKMGAAMGLYFTGTGVGIGAALATTAFFPSSKSAFVTAGIIMLVVWILWMTLIKNKPEGIPDLPVMPMSKYLGVAARSRNVWLVGLAMMFYMASFMAFSGFLPNALNQVYGMSPVKAGFMASLVTLGTIGGSLIGPAISGSIGRIKGILIPVAVFGAITAYTSWVAPQGVGMSALFILLGVLSGVCTPLLTSYPLLLPEVGPVYAGSAGGIIGTLQVTGAVFIPSLVIAPLAGQNYNLFFALGSLCFLMVAVFVLFLPELGSKAH